MIQSNSEKSPKQVTEAPMQSLNVAHRYFIVVLKGMQGQDSKKENERQIVVLCKRHVWNLLGSFIVNVQK